MNEEKKFRRLIREEVRSILFEEEEKVITIDDGDILVQRLNNSDSLNSLEDHFATMYFTSSDPGRIDLTVWTAKVINNTLSVFDYGYIGNYTKEIESYKESESLMEIEVKEDESVIFRIVSNKGPNNPGSIRIEKGEIDYVVRKISNLLDIPERISFDYSKD